MENEDEVAIPFNRRSLWGLFGLAALLSLSGGALVALFGSCVLLDTPHTGLLTRGIYAVFLALFCLCYGFTVQWALFLGRCLRRDLPAVVFRRDGIFDNASGYWVGLLPWSDLARIYPSEIYLGLRFASRVRLRVPYRRRRMVTIEIKDAVGFRSRLPWLKATCLRLEQPQGTLRIGDGLLAVTAEEFMRRLNDYYVTRVRRDGLP